MQAAICLTFQATAAVDNGDIETARSQIAITLNEVMGSGDFITAAMFYLIAYIELLASDLRKS